MSQGNCLLSKDGKKLILGCKNSIIPSNITTIGESAFEGCSNLVSINIPSSVKEIDQCAFWECTSLTSVIIENNTDKILLDWGSFCGCESLSNVIIASKEIEIKGSVFDACDNLTNIFFKGTQSDWSEIQISSEGNNVIDGKVRYYSETQPEENVSNYWHYDADGKTPIIWEAE